MKKLLTIFLAIGLIASMTACGNDTKEEATTKNTTENTTQNNDNGNASESMDDGEVVIEEYSGKTLAEIMEAGYEYTGYVSMNGAIQIYLDSDKADENIEELKNSITGLTVAELVDKYDISFGYDGFNGEYTFIAYIGSVAFTCDLENGKKALQAHEDESFFDLEEAEEIQNDKLENIALEIISFTADLDDASSKKLSELDDIDEDVLEEMGEDIVVSKLYYTVD